MANLSRFRILFSAASCWVTLGAFANPEIKAPVTAVPTVAAVPNPTIAPPTGVVTVEDATPVTRPAPVPVMLPANLAAPEKNLFLNSDAE